MNFPRATARSPISRHFKLALPIALAALALTLPRCGQTPTSSGPAAGTFTNVYSIITTSNCNQCHVPAVSAGSARGSTLDFTSATTAYTTLTTQNVTATDSSANCGTVKIVNKTTPANSYLLAIFTQADQVTGFGGAASCKPDTSHLAGTANITGDELTTINNWIIAGAPQN